MNKRIYQIVLTGAFCWTTATMMHAKMYYVLNAAPHTVYVGLFSINPAGQITATTTPLVYKLPKSYRTKISKPYATFNDHDKVNLKFMFSTNFHELVDALENRPTTRGTVFSYPSIENQAVTTLDTEPATTFEIQSADHRISELTEETTALPITLTMIAVGSDRTVPKGTPVGNKAEVYYKQQKEAQRIKREPKPVTIEKITTVQTVVPVLQQVEPEPVQESEIEGVSFHTQITPAVEKEKLVSQQIQFHEPQAQSMRPKPVAVPAVKKPKKSFLERAKSFFTRE